MTASSAGTLVEAFSDQVRRTPDAPALSWRDSTLSYAELDRRANQLAHLLAGLDGAAGRPVGLLLSRSPDTVIALLAVLKAGGCYLALHPANPASRQRQILAEAGAGVLITDRDPGLPGITAVRLPALREQIAGQPDTAPELLSWPDSTAYISYTSGSTGVPKGVCVPHRAVLELALRPSWLSIEPSDAVLHAAPLAFDASTFEIWTPLLNGARLALLDSDDPTPEAVASTIDQAGVTVAWLTAGLFHQVVDSECERLRGVRYLVAGGDVLSGPRVSQALSALPDTTLVNGYGPTENTTFSCCYRVPADFDGADVPIGLPVDGAGVRILDGKLQQASPGECGELYLTGTGLASGYAGQPALTAERFVADPDAAGQRMYRTGDLVRQDPDGVIRFVGRSDRQVKISGYRIEPAEVELALTGCPGILDAAVLAQPGPTGDRRLVAFVAAGADRTISTLAVRARLAEVLPRYAVPTSVVVLTELPLTPNGKVDRAELQARTGRDRPEVGAPYRSPDSPTEQAMATIWQDLMELSEVGVDDDFFELGGYSLLGTRITAEVSREYGVSVTPRQFYESGTVARLAALVERLRAQAEHDNEGTAR